jgi:hypothetical protein
MKMDGIDYVYVETHDWDRSADFWMALGFKLTLRIEDAGRFEPTDGGPGVFVEVVPPEQPLTTQIYLRCGEAERLPDRVDVVEDFAPSHWGTELATVRDPDGRTFVIQRPGESSHW